MSFFRIGSALGASLLVLCFYLQTEALGQSAVSTPSPSQSCTQVTDMLGRCVTVPESPKRVVALGAGTLRLVIYAGGAEFLSGVEAYEKRGFRGRPYAESENTRLMSLPIASEGGPGRPANPEALLSTRPDVVFTNGFDRAQLDSLYAQIRIPLVAISYGEELTEGDDAVTRSLKLIGGILGTGARVDHLLASIQEIHSDLHKRTTPILPTRPTVYVGAVAYRGEQGLTTSQSQFLPLRLINANNLADSLSQRISPIFIDREQILAWNPDILFIDGGGLDLVEQDVRQNPDYYQHLTAVRNGRVFTTMPYNYYAANIEIALVNAYFMAKIISPDRFANIDFEEKANDIFQAFVGKRLFDSAAASYRAYGQVTIERNTLKVRALP